MKQTRSLTSTNGERHSHRLSDGRGPSSPHHGSQAPSLDHLEPCGKRLDSNGERLAQDEERLHKERLG